MPLYSFLNEETNETIDIFMSMNDKHEYVDEHGFQWRRLFTVPYTSLDVNLDPRSKKDFIRRTEKYSKLGDLMDCSKELSEKREQKDGRDGVKDKFFEDYKRNRNGKEHPASKPKKIETKHATVDFTAKG